MQRQRPLIWTRHVIIASLVALSACSNSDTGSSQQTDDGFIFTAPANTDTLSNDLPENEVAAIVALGATGAERTPSSADADTTTGATTPTSTAPHNNHQRRKLNIPNF
jgi:hypothetical protein